MQQHLQKGLDALTKCLHSRLVWIMILVAIEAYIFYPCAHRGGHICIGAIVKMTIALFWGLGFIVFGPRTVLKIVMTACIAWYMTVAYPPDNGMHVFNYIPPPSPANATFVNTCGA